MAIRYAEKLKYSPPSGLAVGYVTRTYSFWISAFLIFEITLNSSATSLSFSCELIISM